MLWFIATSLLVDHFAAVLNFIQVYLAKFIEEHTATVDWISAQVYLIFKEEKTINSLKLDFELHENNNI